MLFTDGVMQTGTSLTTEGSNNNKLGHRISNFISPTAYSVGIYLFIRTFKIVEKRATNRISINQKIILSSDNLFSIGTFTNCSEQGMYIKTAISFPLDSIQEILIPLKEEILRLAVKVVRIEKKGNVYDGLGVKLLNTPKDFLKFLIKLELIGSAI